MLFITGDTHGMQDRLNTLLDYLAGCPQTEEKHLLICGDFGYLFLDNQKERELTGYLDWVRAETKYKHWYFGHFHLDGDVDEKHTCLLNQIRRLE